MPSRTESLRVVDPILSSIARGYSNEEMIGENIFPVVNVEKEAGTIPLFGKEHFQVWETHRSLRADSNEMEGGELNKTPYATEEHDLIRRLDYREVEEAMLSQETQAVNDVMAAISLKKEVMYANQIQDLANYEDANKVTLASGYYDDDTVNLVKEITEHIHALESIIGKRPNTMVLPSGVWRGIRFNKTLASYTGVKVGGADLFNVNATVDILANLLEIEKVYIGRAKYTTDKKTFKNVWTNNIFLAYITPPSGIERTPYQPCYGYTLRKKGNPFSDKWTENNGKLIKVRTTDNFDIKVVGAESGYIIKNAINPANYTE